MKDKMVSPVKNSVNKYVCLFIFIWTAAIAVSLAWNVSKIKEEYLTIVHTKARDIIQSNRMYRKWNASMGGVYVNATPQTPPSPYLSHLPDRDLVLPSGKRLTLITPAYMSRLVFDVHLKDINMKGRITGINPLNPNNAPDAWEKAALASFRDGKDEVSTIQKIGTETYIRLMIPFYTDQSCVRCHAGKGYKVGDLQGGINVTLPITTIVDLQQSRIKTLLFGHGIFFIVGLFGIMLSGKRISGQIRRIREEEARYHKIFETNQAIKLVIDASDGSIVDANKAASTFYGHTIDELTNKKLYEINTLNPEELQREITKIISEKKLNFIFKHRLASGEIRDVEVFSSPVQVAGKMLLYSIIHDITERNRATEALKQAYQSVEREVTERTSQLTIANESLNKINTSLQRELNISQALSELYEQLTSPDSTVVDIASTVLNRSMLLTGSRHGYVSSIDPVTGDNVGHTMTEMMFDGCKVSPENQRISFPCNKDGTYGGLWGHSLNTLQGFFTNSPYTHESSNGIPEGHIRLKNFLSVPVFVKDKLIGQIALANKDEDYSENDFQAVKQISMYYALILQKKMAEEALQVSLTKYQTLFESFPLGITVSDKDGNILETNQMAETILSVRKEDHEQRRLDDPNWKILRPDGNPMPAEEYAAVRALKENRLIQGIEMGLNKTPLETVWLNVTAAPIPMAGYGVIVIYSDMTEHKLLEMSRNELLAQRQAILESVPIGIAYLINRRFIWCNSKMAEQFGYSLEEFVGKTTEFLYPSEEDYEEIGSQGYPILNRGESFVTERLIKCKDNTLTWCFMSAKIINPDNQSSGYLWIIEDISKRKNDEEALIKAREDALSANRAKSEFLANMSHEIRTPMNSVMGFADLLIKSHLDKKQLEFVSAIKQASSNLMFILNDILDISKIEAGKLELESIIFNLYDLCDQVIEAFEVLANKRGIGLHLEMSPDLRVKLHGDPNRLRQILINLVGNAVKFTSSGSVELVVTQCGNNLYFGETNTVTLIFAVTDTGLGIPADQREAIFDPFTQVDASTKRKYGGTGLGLNICKKLVALMGGEIWVKSSEGVGSTFYFTAHFELVHDSESPSIGKEKEQPIFLRPLRILLAEDDVLNQRFATEVLRSQGHSVELAVDGKEVINKLTTKPFDLILMDISMPDMDGTEVTKVIRGSTLNFFDSKIPIIAQTAHALKGDRERFLESGMDGYITKPIDIDELSAVIRQVMPHFILKD
ncbi:MAG: PAS domain S-box protein [Deltaproteobacteria bacterium]|nr:PAS domain S-box protein [Deltaproteobacteria bacterium]